VVKLKPVKIMRSSGPGDVCVCAVSPAFELLVDEGCITGLTADHAMCLLNLIADMQWVSTRQSDSHSCENDAIGETVMNWKNYWFKTRRMCLFLLLVCKSSGKFHGLLRNPDGGFM